MKTYHTFKDIDRLTAFLRTSKWNSGELDFITVGGIVYTMHEFDDEGKYMNWANKKHDTLIQCDTSNRYSPSGFSDADCWLQENWGMLRSDISYHE